MYKNMQKYTKICKNIQQYTKIYKKYTRNTKIYKYIYIYKNIQKCTTIYNKYTKIYTTNIQRIYNNIQKYMQKYAKIYKNSSGVPYSSISGCPVCRSALVPLASRLARRCAPFVDPAVLVPCFCIFFVYFCIFLYMFLCVF